MMKELLNLNFEELELNDEDLQEELKGLEEELSACGFFCTWDNPKN